MSTWLALAREVSRTKESPVLLRVQDDPLVSQQENLDDKREVVPDDGKQRKAARGSSRGDGLRVTGRVVGIVERRWRPYCGSFELTDKKSGLLVLNYFVFSRAPIRPFCCREVFCARC